MHTILAFTVVFLFWRAIRMMDAYFTRRDSEKNLWRLLFLAFLGAIIRKLIERKPRDEGGGNAFRPQPRPPGPTPPDFDFDGLFNKAIESVKRYEKTKVG